MVRTSSAAPVQTAPWRSAPGLGDVRPLRASGSPAETTTDLNASSSAALHVTTSRQPRSIRPAPISSDVDSDTDSLMPLTPEPAAELADPPARFDEETPPAKLQRHDPPPARLVGEPSFLRSVWSWEPVSDVEASSFAGRFACDFQSFDQDAPWRRAEVLREVLADPQACTWGWSGVGRQRADSPLPGRIYRRSDTVVFVEVVVRVTSYVRAGAVAGADGHPENDGERGEWGEPAGMIGRSCAPPEADSAWAAAQAWWVRMTVPVTRAGEDGRLVVDPGLLSGPAGEQAGER